jgi:biopolymer transport protein ExbD
MMQGPPGGDFEDFERDESIFADINITPLTDVFLVLLIIFMVVSSSMVEEERTSSSQGRKLLEESALQVKTPQGSGSTIIMAKDLIITVEADGSTTMEGSTFPLSELRGRLTERASETPLPRVIVRGDEQAYYKLVWEVIGIARSAGYDDVALSARSKP